MHLTWLYAKSTYVTYIWLSLSRCKYDKFYKSTINTYSTYSAALTPTPALVYMHIRMGFPRGPPPCSPEPPRAPGSAKAPRCTSAGAPIMGIGAIGIGIIGIGTIGIAIIGIGRYRYRYNRCRSAGAP